MSLIHQVVESLDQRNRFSLSNGHDLSSQLCLAWFISKLPEHLEYDAAHFLLKNNSEHSVCQYINQSEALIPAELSTLAHPNSQQQASDLTTLLSKPSEHPLWSVFSPEALACKNHATQTQKLLLASRTLHNIELQSAVLDDVSEQLLLTSNVLLGLPLAGDDISAIDLGLDFHKCIHAASHDPQEFWYDHPIPIGIDATENEILYGLKHLDAALAVEIQRGNMAAEQKLDVVLSCSVTHSKLASIAKDYVEYEIRKNLSLQHLRVFVFTEDLSAHVIKTSIPNVSQDLKQAFGVNGYYGRHYTFLKAIAALWQKSINSSLKATFKIDLDQVFDQTLLIEQSGKSFFEHLLTSNWGANATDANGQAVYLGLLAGGLVNESDIKFGLFTPDVKAPTPDSYATFEQLFCARWSQALSTQTEIVHRQNNIQRVHVTGGINGILIDALYRFRPFSPSFIHRAEDQALYLSLLDNENQGQSLVYAHQAGLIMRHDKDAFAQRAMLASANGKDLGDIERILLFSHYAKAHTLDLGAIKQKLFPFTGVFISDKPVCLALLRFMLEGIDKHADYLLEGAQRLSNCLAFCQSQLQNELESNRSAWNEYYDALANGNVSPLVQDALMKSRITLE